MDNMLMWLIIFLIIGFIGHYTENKLKRNTNVNYKRKEFLTEKENKFYQKLKPLEEEYKIIPQINLATIIEKESNIKYQNELYRNIDYAIFTKDYKKLLLLIELNDNTHNQPKRKQRDIKVQEICKKASIPILTFHTNYPNEQQYVLKRIKEEIKKNTIILPPSK